MRILERKLENAEEGAATRAKSGAGATAGERGFSLKSADGAYELKLRLAAQADGRFVLDAWQLTASYVLTGEDAGYRGVAKPAKPFATGEASAWGAFEMVLRASELDVDDAAFAGFADAATQASNAFTWGAGVNWYPTANARLSLNYLLTEFEGGAAAGADRADEKAVLARLQVAY